MGFFACYLLTPARPPQRLRCTYVGFTVAPTRRIRQHNGEIANGAKRTRKFRPWQMVAVVHGFPSKFRALQFEWVWQHPHVSKITKQRLEFLRGSRGLGAPRSVKRKVLEMLEMVNLEPFKGLNLTVSFTTDEMHDIARALGARYSAANCETRALDTFAGVELENASTTISICFICECELYPEQEMESESEKSFEQVVGCYHEDCEMWCHTSCLVDHFRSTKDLDSVEEQGPNLSGECPQCEQVVQWPLLTQHHGSNRDKRKRTKSGKSNQTKKKVRAVCSQTESNEDKGSEDLLEERSTNENAVRKRGNENGGDSISIDSASSYNSDGWFEDDVDDTSMDLESMETDHAWEKSAPNILDVEIPTRSANDMGTIDLTED